MFEVEFRSMFDLKKYNEVKEYLDKNADNLGRDNKDCYYYIFSDKLLKLVNSISKNTAKISLKLNHIGKGAVFPEIEFNFPRKEFDKAVKLFNALSLPAKVMHESQKRINYWYKNCEIALKYSNTWGYHLEIEQVIDSKDKQDKAKRQIRELAKELKINLMSEEELKKFTKEVENKL